MWHGRGGHGSMGAPQGGLPFAGIPPEMTERVEELIAGEPDFADTKEPFSHTDYARERFTLWNFLAPYKFRMAGALALLALTEMLLLVGPYLVKVAIDDGIMPGNMTVLYWVGAVYLGSLVVVMLVSGVRMRYTGRLGQLLMYQLRVQVFSHLQRLSLDYFTDEKAGRLLTRMTSDIEALANLLQTGLINLVAQTLKLIFIIGLLLSFNVELTIVLVVATAPIMLGMTMWFSVVSERGYDIVRDRIAGVLSDLQESLSGMRLIISFNRMRHNIIHHRNIVSDYQHANNYTALISSFYQSGTSLLQIAATLFIVIAGYFILLDVNPTLDPAGAFTVGALVAFINLVARFFAPIQQLVTLYNEFQSGNAAVTKLREVLSSEPTVAQAANAVIIDNMKGDIQVDGVYFGYDDTPVLENVSLHIKSGESISFVGPTGAGKSTLAKLITRFYDPDQGSIKIDGHDLKDVDLTSLHSQLGVVPQEPFLFHGSIGDNIRFSRPDATHNEVMAACEAVGIDDMIERLPNGLDTPCHERGSSLSSGERQLLALARAFLAQPRVLVLDEATSNVDQKSESRIESALDNLLGGRTAIIIAHRLATARRADRIAVINDKGILEMGSHDELLAQRGYYAGMYATWEQQQGH
jgi:ATP-binding cassette subfamily B protein